MIVFLIGFMGSGKSYWGNLLAKELGFSFIDSDKEIEKGEQQSISDIFSNKGEKYFRELEKTWLETFNITNSVVSVGGGLPIYNDNMDLLLEKGKVIFIEETFEVIYKRIRQDIDRPLVNSTTEKELSELYNNRLSIYKRAHIKIKSPRSVHGFLTKLEIR